MQQEQTKIEQLWNTKYMLKLFFDRGNSKLDKGRNTQQENIQDGSFFLHQKLSLAKTQKGYEMWAFNTWRRLHLGFKITIGQA